MKSSRWFSRFALLTFAALFLSQPRARARYSVRKISELLTGMEQQPLFSGLDINIEWLESTGLPQIIRFTSAISGESRGAEFKDQLMQVLDLIRTAVKT